MVCNHILECIYNMDNILKPLDKWINKKLDINYKWKIGLILMAFIVGVTIRFILTP